MAEDTEEGTGRHSHKRTKNRIRTTNESCSRVAKHKTLLAAEHNNPEAAEEMKANQKLQT